MTIKSVDITIVTEMIHFYLEEPEVLMSFFDSAIGTTWSFEYGQPQPLTRRA